MSEINSVLNMNKRSLAKNFAFIFIVFMSFKLSAQNSSTDCSVALKNGYASHESGDFKECINILTPCLNSIPKGVVFEAYRLMALSSMNLSETDNAHEYIVKMLNANPSYRDFPFFDPLAFKKLLDKYEIWAKWELGAKWGLVVNGINPIANYSLTNSEASYNSGMGYQIGLSTEYFLRKNISLGADVLFARSNYSRTAEDVSGWEQEYQERMNYLEIPVQCRYYFFQTENLEIGAELGLQTSILSSTTSNITFTSFETNELKQSTYQADNQRNNLLIAGLGGLVAKYQLGGGKLGLNIRYTNGFSNVVDPDTRYDNLVFSFNNQYVDSDFSFNNLAMSLSYSFPIPNLYSVHLAE